MADDLLANPRKTVAKIVSGNPAYQPVHDEGEIEGYIDQVLPGKSTEHTRLQSWQRARLWISGRSGDETFQREGLSSSSQ